MASLEIHQPWTLCGLIGAFVDLALAYFLLCASTFAFFASKLLGVVGLRLPCPCEGVFGFRSAEFCWHRLLVEWPVKMIYGVQMLVKSRFPFTLVWLENERDSSKKSIREGNCENRVVEADGEACCSSFSGPRNQNVVDRESGSDVKGKRLVNPKQRYGIRRRRRATLAYGKFASVFASDGLPLGESLGRRSGKDDDARGKYERSQPLKSFINRISWKVISFYCGCFSCLLRDC